MKYITFVPLIGGMALANELATGNKPECVLSYDAFAKNESNLKNYWKDVKWYVLNAETNKIDGEQPDFTDIDFVSSVCPCAGMSCLNTATRSADNETNNWLYKVADYTLGTIKPKVYWGENVPCLYSEQNVKVLESLREYGNKYGYSFTIYKTNTYLHGIPQQRIRTFFFFWKDSSCPMLEWYNNINKKPFETWILDKNNGTQNASMKSYKPEDLYPEMRWIMTTRCDGTYEDYIKFFYKLIDEHSIRTPYDYIKHFNLWQEYKDWLEKDPQKDKLMSEQGYRTPWYYINYRWDKIKRGLGYFAPQPIVYKGYTNAIISKNMFWTLHPLEDRFLSTREILSLMGMPSDFELISGNLQHATQNVPVTTARDMTKQVMKFINNELPITTSSFMKMNNLTQKVDWEEQSCIKLF